MGPCFSSCSSHCFVEKYFLKNQRGSQSLWEAPGGTKELALRSECWGLQGSTRQSVLLLGSAGALHSHPTTAQASFLTVSLPEGARSWGRASSGWESGDLRAGLSLASPSARMPLAQFPYWYLKGTPVSLLSYAPILEIRRLSHTHYSPIICLLPTVLLGVPSSAVLLLKKAVHF